MWTDDPVRDAERYQDYLEEHGEEIPESDFYKGLCEIYEIINDYNREMRRRSNGKTDSDSARVEGSEK